ncbi:MAG: nicotinate phosphoribosyltransferase [Synergistaceae bacterium]|nr:nicotinate phosphoribosyltransferase [Synergistaceae bacterium]
MTTKRNLTLLTDLYELTMMQGYFKNEKRNKIAVFDVFYRKNPLDGGYAIFAGLEQVIEYVKNLHFDEDSINYLRSLNLFGEDFLDYLASFRFTGTIYSVPEGTVIFPSEPIVKVIAPVMQAQLVETAILNIINHQSLIATKAARVCHAAGDKPVFEFGARRAQGPDASIYGARAAIIGGCLGTSNVISGQMFDVPLTGTNAHAWMMSFDTELEAFEEYARIYPKGFTFVADTYDTLKSGVPNAIKVFQKYKDKGELPAVYGIRLDSGDLAYLSKEVRKMFDKAGFPDARIIVSNDLDEFLIHSLKTQGAKVDVWAVGTHLITSKDWASFGGVYKLAAIENDKGELTPKIKFSENIEKNTNPGNKKIFRIYDNETGKIKADLICLADETLNESEDLLLFDPMSPWKKTCLDGGTYKVRELLACIFDKGNCIYNSPTTNEIKEICKKEKATLWDETKRFANPTPVWVDLSQKLFDLKMDLFNKNAKHKYH